jgi:hypothetical protein
MNAKKNAQSIPMVRQRLSSAKFPPASLVQLLSADDWEGFIEDCCRVQMGVGKKYVYVQRIGGAGDGGRDIEARFQDDLAIDQWDLYQGKLYAKPIGESVLYPELAKVFHHISLKTYPSPRNYFICAPKNTTPTLHDIIAKSHELKSLFLAAWKDGKKGIDTKLFPLTSMALEVAEKFNYKKIREMPVKDLLGLHAQNAAAHAILFGIETVRGGNPVKPKLPATEEQKYIEELLKVYSEHSKSNISIASALTSSDYSDHLEGCRSEFYCAEGLKRFSRDVHPGEFENLVCAVHDGVRRIIASPKLTNGMDRVEAVLSHASTLQVTENPLSKKLLPSDLPGTCHHLTNDGKIRWVK